MEATKRDLRPKGSLRPTGTTGSRMSSSASYMQRRVADAVVIESFTELGRDQMQKRKKWVAQNGEFLLRSISPDFGVPNCKPCIENVLFAISAG